MKEIMKSLPEGWQAKAKELGAMERKSGVIRSAETLLRLNMLYVTNGGSFQMAAQGLALTEGLKLSKVAAFKRIKNSGEWMRWMAKELCEGTGMAIPKPEFLGERHVVLIDASSEGVKGGKGGTYRLHYAFDLFNFRSKSVEVTGINEGEKLSRYQIGAGEIAMADRMYCSMAGIEHVVSGGGDYLLRFRANAFNLYDENGVKLALLPLLRKLKPLEGMDIPCFYKLDGRLRPVRIVAMKKDAKAIEASKRKMARKASKEQRRVARADTVELCEYVVLVTSLEDTNEQILELYRARWQIEQLFYRLKSLFGFGDTPSKRDDTVRAWFYGKLLLAAWCESILKTMSFPPELDTMLVDIVGTQFMERIVPDLEMGHSDSLAVWPPY